MSTDGISALLGLLADGAWHSGEALATELGVSRAAIWKRMKRLESLPGVHVERVSGRGYRLSRPVELLRQDAILGRLDDAARRRLQELHLPGTTSSTNSYLQERCVPLLNGGVACLAEHQTAGRGRRGRTWVSPFGRNLYLSLMWRFDLALPDLAGLSLASGVALARVLQRAGLRGHCLKWPNDLLVDGRKLAGILVEASGEANGPCSAIIGVGVNLEIDAEGAESIDQPWTHLRDHLKPLPGRNRLAGDLLQELIHGCLRYQQEGLEPFLEEWRAWDGFRGERIRLILGDRSIEGIHAGLDRRGGLLLDREGRREVFYSGEVSMRKAHGH